MDYLENSRRTKVMLAVRRGATPRRWLLFFWLLLAISTGCSREPAAPVADPPLRISMADLHANGGVPPGWRFKVPPGDVDRGRATFFEYECYTCHKVEGEPFPDEPRQEGEVGPELTGMGAHHPPEYFAESIVNPNAIVVDGPGYVSPTGTSIMPSYEGMTLQELTNLVAYVGSLRGGGDMAAHAHMNHAMPGAPAGQSTVSQAFFAQAYAVPSERIDAFYEWFEGKGYTSVAGLSSIETFASRLRDGQHQILCLFGFESDAALQAFLPQLSKAPATPSFVHPVSQYALRSGALYRATQMSFP